MHEEIAEAFSLAGRVAVVTGAASGIGRETAILLSRAGAKLVLADVNEDGLNETASEIGAEQRTALVVPTDVSRRERIDALAEKTLQAMGRLDIWVNAAGILIRRPMAPAASRRLDANEEKGSYDRAHSRQNREV